MRIVVTVKHVPDVQSERALSAEHRVVRGGDDDTINELDEDAVEAALQLAEGIAGGERADHEVVVLTVGPAPAVDAVRRALAMGADSGVHVRDDAVAGSDALATAEVIAAAVRLIGADAPVDVVVTGMAGLDGLSSLVPAALAQHLGAAQLTLASRIEVEGGRVRVHREVSGATEVLSAATPVVVSVTDQAFRARFASFPGIIAARKKQVRVLDLADLGLDPSRAGAAGSRTRVVESAPRPPRADRVLVHDDGTAAAQLADFLVARDLLRPAAD